MEPIKTLYSDIFVLFESNLDFKGADNPKCHIFYIINLSFISSFTF